MSKGIVVREGVVDVKKVKRYAKKNKIPFIDLRQGMNFANIDQLNRHLTLAISNVYRRPIRANVNSFFRGECFGKKFVAVVPHNFVNDYAITTKKSPATILNALCNNESLLM